MSHFDIYETPFQKVHFIGIGGVSMSGIAKILNSEGYQVSGSDKSNSDLIKDLKVNNITIFDSHDTKNITTVSPDLVVYTDAISSDNPEYKEALNLNITTVDRGTFLGQLMRRYKNSIAIAGTHGKTSTTGMLSVLLGDSDLNPTILLGGYLKQLDSNLQIGDRELLITEACEYKGNILKFHSTIGVILNIEADHLDYYKSLNEIVDTFKGFVKLIPNDGYLVINNDDLNTSKVTKDLHCNLVTFAIDNNATYKAENISLNSNGTTTYTLVVNDSDRYDIKLNILGIHNVYNSLAAISSAHTAGVDLDYLISKILDYRGTERRLQFKGYANGIQIVDDYAHHPTEIKVTLSALKSLDIKKIWCVFQPHTYTRTKSLLDDFSLSFFDADKIIITNIYAAREKDTGLIHSKNLVEKLQNKNIDAIYIDDFNDIANYLREHASPDDLIITMGAGDIYLVGNILLS